MQFALKKLIPLIKLGQKGTECLLFSKNGVECQFSKLGRIESNFAKTRGYQCNLLFVILSTLQFLAQILLHLNGLEQDYYDVAY